MKKSAEKSAALWLVSASESAFFFWQVSAFIFSKCERERECVLFLSSERERERVRHFEERANALYLMSLFHAFNKLLKI